MLVSTRVKKTLEGEKRVAEGRRTAMEPLTLAHWQAHLAGEMGLGIVPCRLDATVVFGALDVDKYDIEDLHFSLPKRVDKLGLPIVITRSKSGGAHLWVFFCKPVPAKRAIAFLEWARDKLRLDKKTEIFPKQASVENMDAGSWINLPYFGGLRRTTAGWRSAARPGADLRPSSCASPKAAASTPTISRLSSTSRSSRRR